MDIEIRPEEVFSLAAAVAIIPVIVAHMKPALRRIWPDDGPWELIADAIGVLWVLGIWQAGFAPEWVVNPWAAVLAGVAVGVASSRARDAVQAVTSARSFRDEPEPYDEPGRVAVARSSPWAGIAPDPVSIELELDEADLLGPRESRSVIKAM